jgi:hypothetical protein
MSAIAELKGKAYRQGYYVGLNNLSWNPDDWEDQFLVEFRRGLHDARAAISDMTDPETNSEMLRLEAAQASFTHLILNERASVKEACKKMKAQGFTYGEARIAALIWGKLLEQNDMTKSEVKSMNSDNIVWPLIMGIVTGMAVSMLAYYSICLLLGNK